MLLFFTKIYLPINRRQISGESGQTQTSSLIYRRSIQMRLLSRKSKISNQKSKILDFEFGLKTLD